MPVRTDFQPVTNMTLRKAPRSEPWDRSQAFWGARSAARLQEVARDLETWYSAALRSWDYPDYGTQAAKQSAAAIAMAAALLRDDALRYAELLQFPEAGPMVVDAWMQSYTMLSLLVRTLRDNREIFQRVEHREHIPVGG